MKKIASLVVGVVLMFSCHHGDTARPEDIKVLDDTAKVEASRRAVTAPLPSQDSYIPPIPKNNADVCDTLKPKGGQNMVIGYTISAKQLEKLDDTTKVKVVAASADFGAYFTELVKNFPPDIESLNTSACYISMGDTILATAKDKFGIIFVNANGTVKIIPGVRTADEWKDIMKHFFKMTNSDS